MQDIIEFRLDEHDKQIERIRKNSHDTTTSLIVVNEAIKSITKNIEDVVRSLISTSDRVRKIEEDFSKIIYRNTLLKSAVTNWPFIIITIILLASLDMTKFIQLLKSVH